MASWTAPTLSAGGWWFRIESAPDGRREVGITSFEVRGYRLRLVECPEAFDRDGVYGDDGGDYADNAWRFGLFCRSVLGMLRVEAGAGRRADLLHLHDWHATPALLFRDGPLAGDRALAALPVLLTLHNLAYHGRMAPDALAAFGLTPGNGVVPPGLDRLDPLAEAVSRAELVNTVSPAYARQALEPAFGFGLQDRLRARGDRFLGILNGIDPAVWNPAGDSALTAGYSRTNLAGKAACRSDLLVRVGFDPDDPGPVLGMIGRLDPQKGFDILADATPRLLELGARVIVLGSGEHELARTFADLAARAPTRVALLERFDRAMARRIYAGADMFVMPSRFEPSGQGQMIAMRYGTPPIGHATGGLLDSIVDVDVDAGAGTGFLFRDDTPEALLAACRRAFALRGPAGRRPAWSALVQRAMAVDLSWESASAPAYIAAYRRAIDLRGAAIDGPAPDAPRQARAH